MLISRWRQKNDFMNDRERFHERPRIPRPATAPPEDDRKEDAIVQSMLKSMQWSSSELIPFQETYQSREFMNWLSNFSADRPCCLLCGPTSSGKSRLIEVCSFRKRYHIIELDCASISGIKELIANADESTQSRSVGTVNGVFERSNARENSIVVLEHVDALIPACGNVPKSLLGLCARSKVPFVMTSYTDRLSPQPWLTVINCTRNPSAFQVIMNSYWMRGLTNDIGARQHIHTLLNFTEGDIRRTSLQFQIMKNSDHVIDRQEKIYLSIPQVVNETNDKKKKRHKYSMLCDCLLNIDPDDSLFNDYIRPVGQRFNSLERNISYQRYTQFSCKKLGYKLKKPIEILEVTRLMKIACENAIDFTRQRNDVELNIKPKLTNIEIEIVKSWDFWPRFKKDIPQFKKDNQDTQNESKVQFGAAANDEANTAKYDNGSHQSEPKFSLPITRSQSASARKP